MFFSKGILNLLIRLGANIWDRKLVNVINNQVTAQER